MAYIHLDFYEQCTINLPQELYPNFDNPLHDADYWEDMERPHIDE